MITFLTVLLILLCLVVIFLIMIQRTSGGMGSALGGGAADQVLGAGSAAQLTKLTVYGIGGFFILAFVLYGFYQNNAANSDTLIRTGVESPSLQPTPDFVNQPIEEIPVPTPSADITEVPSSPEPTTVPIPPLPEKVVAPISGVDGNSSK